MPEFIQRSLMPVSAADLFAWHSRPGAFDRLLPPWESIELRQPAASLTDGARAELLMRIGPLRQRWVAAHHALPNGEIGFRDEQIIGPFAQWEHTHSMQLAGEGCCWLEDRVQYRLPMGWFGQFLGGMFTSAALARTFAYRHRVTSADVSAHHKSQGVGIMNILITGATGLVGSSLESFLTTGGHNVRRLVRKGTGRDDEIVWNPDRWEIDAAKLEGLDAVVHLAGENIATGRWTAAKKARIRDSRVNGTRHLCETLARLSRPPKIFVGASAIGYYGDRGDSLMTEVSMPGTSFLCDVCRDWESASEPAKQAGIRVVNLRIGVVLTPRGGALHKMLLPFKLCAGGVVGNGNQYMSWIAIDDVIGAIHHALTNNSLTGPVNAVSPNPVTNREFTKTLGEVLHRPTVFPMPAFAARLAFGEMADELLLSSTRVAPQQLQQSGYQFRFPELAGALKHLLGAA